jgi:hypothetical protein
MTIIAFVNSFVLKLLRYKIEKMKFTTFKINTNSMTKREKEIAEKIISLHKENINQPGFFTWNPMPECFYNEREMKLVKRLVKDHFNLIKDYTDQTTLLTEKGYNFKNFKTTVKYKQIKINWYWVAIIFYLFGIISLDMIKHLKKKTG